MLSIFTNGKPDHTDFIVIVLENSTIRTSSVALIAGFCCTESVFFGYMTDFSVAMHCYKIGISVFFDFNFFGFQDIDH